MSNFIVNKTINFIKKYSDYSETDLNKINYGIEGVYLTISKILVILIIGIIFKYLGVIILTLLFFNILRLFAFGLHAKKSIHCLILSIIEFNILPFVIMNINISYYGILLIGIFSFISFLLFAPSDTEKRPLTNKRKRIIRKISSLIVCIIYILICFKFNFLKNAICCSLLIESIMVNPLCYYILGLKYNNYKKTRA